MSTKTHVFALENLSVALRRMVALEGAVVPVQRKPDLFIFYVEVCNASDRETMLKAGTELGTLERCANISALKPKPTPTPKPKEYVRVLAELIQQQRQAEPTQPVNHVSSAPSSPSPAPKGGKKSRKKPVLPTKEPTVAPGSSAAGTVAKLLAAATAAVQASQLAANSTQSVESPADRKEAAAREDERKLVELINNMQFAFGPELTKEKADGFRALLLSYVPKGLFALKSKTPEVCRGEPFRIELHHGVAPIRQKLRRFSPEEQFLIEENVREWLESGFIRPSRSAWSSNIVLVEKKDGTTRVCCDYRQLNAASVKMATPLPLLDDLLTVFGDKIIHSAMDLASAFQQSAMSPESIPLTAFACHLGMFEWTRLPFGLCNGPAHMQGLLEQVLFGLPMDRFGRFIDDIRVSSGSVDEHLLDLVEVFERLLKAGLQLKLSKCSFLQRQISFMGFIIDESGVHPDPAKLRAMAEMRAPTDKLELLAVLGSFNYYRHYIKRYAHEAADLTKLLKKDVRFVWGPDQQKAFDRLKHILCEEPITLSHPKPGGEWRVYTDGSRQGIAAVLVQALPDPDKPGKLREYTISYDSRKLRPSESNYGASELEALAVVFAAERYRPYVQGRHFTLFTDHSALRTVFKSKDCTNSRIARWAMALQALDFDVRYRPGSVNHVDALSRLPTDEAPPEFDIVKARNDKWNLLWQDELPPPPVQVPGLHHSVLTITEAASAAARNLVQAVNTSVEFVCGVTTRSQSTAKTNQSPQPVPSEATAGPVAHNQSNSAPNNDAASEARASDQRSPGPVQHLPASESAPAAAAGLEAPHAPGDGTGVHHSAAPPHDAPSEAPKARPSELPSSLVQPSELSFEVIRSAQSVDPFSSAMLRFLRGEMDEADHDLLRRYDKSMYLIKDGALYVDLAARLTRRSRAALAHEQLVPTVVIYLPASCRAAALHIAHDDGMSGHFSFHTTSERIKDRFYWHGQAADVENYCRSCLVCAQYKPIQRPLQFPEGTLPFGERLYGRMHLDLIGPIEPPTARGNRLILVAHCPVTKWAEAIPLPSKQAVVVARALLDEVFCRYSFPTHLMSDMGSEFQNQVLKSLNELLQIHQLHSSAYHPEGNGSAESFNRTLKSVLVKITRQRELDWDLYLQSAMLAYRTMNTSTGLSPFVSTLHERPTFPLDMVLQHSASHLDSFAKDVQGRFDLVTKLLRAAYDEAERKKQAANAKLKPVHDAFKAGDHCLLRVESVNRDGDTVPNKFRAKFSGPWTVQSTFNKGLNVVIQRTAPLQVKVVHVSKLKKLHARDPAHQLARSNELSVADFTEGEVLLVKGEKSNSGRHEWDNQIWLARVVGPDPTDPHHVLIRWLEAVKEPRIIKGKRKMVAVPTGAFQPMEAERHFSIDPASIILVFDALTAEGRIPSEVLLMAKQAYEDNSLPWPRIQ